jgi:hypothetical protein
VVALYAFEGTWNSEKSGEEKQDENTNVERFARAYQRHSGTNDFYVAGVGTRVGVVGAFFGGAFGLGEQPRLDEAYQHLCREWANGDHVVDVVGFSRGAATALDFCHLVQGRGIRKPDADDVVEPNPEIRFLGVWDVVGAFGLAFLGNVALDFGHHLSLPRARLKYCFHALALDERRPSFLPTRLDGACEVWFRGVHSDIGGGNKNRGLNDVTLTWMFRKAQAAGLPITDDEIAALHPDPSATPNPAAKLPFDIRLVSAVDRRHYTAGPRPPWLSAPDTCIVESTVDEKAAVELSQLGVQVLSGLDTARLMTLWNQAQAVAKDAAGDISLDEVKDPLLTLFQSRLRLITNDDQLRRGCEATEILVRKMIRGAAERGYQNKVPAFFLTEALFNSPRLFPLTD